MIIKKPAKSELIILMTAGCLLGILCFALVYGFKIVNPTYDAWIFHGDYDLMQHYMGFCHFRNTPPQFPIGLIDSLSEPYKMSVVYTDSIPLFALIFKLLRGLLPVKFQYFGIFALMNFCLMGALSPVLIRRFTNYKTVCVLGSLFFILSFPIIQRTFYHTALSAQWIIVLALIVWFYSDITDLSQNKRLCLVWALTGVLSVSIHSYFVFMTGIILCAQVIEGVVGLKSRGGSGVDFEADSVVSESDSDNSNKGRLVQWIKNNIFILYPLLSMGVASFAMLYVLGGFYGSGSVSGDGFGDFNANLTAYINPLEYSRLFKGLPLNGMFEFEGFAYLGAGILLILAVWFICFIYCCIKKNKPELTLRKKVIIFTVILVLLGACFPRYSIAGIKLINIPLPHFVRALLGICRTNARFVWVGMYLIIAGALYFIGQNYEKLWVRLILAAAVILQVYDLSGAAGSLHDKYAVAETYESVWEGIEADGKLAGKSRFVFMYRNEDTLMMDTAYTAYLKGMSQNCFYYARTINDEIESNCAEWNEEFRAGNVRDDVVYIFAEADFDDEARAVAESAGAEVMIIPGNVVVSIN